MKKELPSSYMIKPGQDPHKYFRNLCIEFIKLLKRSKDVELLQIEMEKLFNASKDLTWKEDHNKPLKQEVGEKALAKVWHEFKVYIGQLISGKEGYNFQDLIDALNEVEVMIKAFEVK